MIEVKELSKQFGKLKAIDGLTFTVNRGDILGFLGPNGAGKSTTMKIISCFLSPSSGNVVVGGESVLTHSIEVRKKLGYMPENAPLYDELSVSDFLHFITKLREIPRARRKESIERVVELCSLEQVYNQFIETLSKGFKRRLSLAQALIHDPPILVLDEPTDGLDPIQKFEVRKLLKKLSKNKAIIFSTHILEEVDAICERVIIITQGKKVFDGPTLSLRAGKMDENFRRIVLGKEMTQNGEVRL